MDIDNRYIVLKHTDIQNYLSGDDMDIIDDICRKINFRRMSEKKESFQGIFIERDWPEYEPTLAMISDQINDQSPPLHPVRCLVAGAGLVMHISAEVLKFAAENHVVYWDGESGTDVPTLIVTDAHAFAKSVSEWINEERDDSGENFIAKFINDAIERAVENGDDGVEYPG